MARIILQTRIEESFGPLPLRERIGPLLWRLAQGQARTNICNRGPNLSLRSLQRLVDRPTATGGLTAFLLDDCLAQQRPRVFRFQRLPACQKIRGMIEVTTPVCKLGQTVAGHRAAGIELKKEF